MTHCRLLSLVLAVAVVTYASAGEQATKASTAAAVEMFHQQFNDGKFDDIWNQAADEFRADALSMAGSKRPYDAWMPHCREGLGRVVSSSTVKWTANTKGSLTTVSLDQDTKFEHSTGVEHFSFLVSDGKVKLRGWSITSPLFATSVRAAQ